MGILNKDGLEFLAFSVTNCDRLNNSGDIQEIEEEDLFELGFQFFEAGVFGQSGYFFYIGNGFHLFANSSLQFSFFSNGGENEPHNIHIDMELIYKSSLISLINYFDVVNK